MPRRLLLPVAAASLAAFACLDALYEDPHQFDPPGGWVVCCSAGRVTTCPCQAAQGCLPDLLPCAGGACAPAGVTICPGTTQNDSGVPHDGGLHPDGGPQVDGGVPADGGSQEDGGSANPPDGGRPYELCCEDAVVTTCRCPPSGCGGQGFVACPGGTCVISGSCP